MSSGGTLRRLVVSITGLLVADQLVLEQEVGVKLAPTVNERWFDRFDAWLLEAPRHYR